MKPARCAAALYGISNMQDVPKIRQNLKILIDSPHSYRTGFYPSVACCASTSRCAKRFPLGIANTFMKPQASIAELLGLVETTGQPPAGRIPHDDPARLLQELDQKLEALTARHQAELEASARAPRRKTARKI
jgi:hypothetical protein